MAPSTELSGPIWAPAATENRDGQHGTAPPSTAPLPAATGQECRSESKMSVHEPRKPRDTSSNLNHNDVDKTVDTARPTPRAKTQSYMDSLVPPSQEKFERIAQIQKEKEKETQEREQQRREEIIQKQGLNQSKHDEESRTRAAELIQKTFRGHRARREMDGFGLDANTRWVTALREAEFRQNTRPRSKNGPGGSSPLGEGDEISKGSKSRAIDRWKKASVVARRAGHDDLESQSSSVSTIDSATPPEEREQVRHESNKLLQRQGKTAQMMGLQYFLEMVDVKHRYGSNLRQYHAEWKKSDTNENFFYWLDNGEGRDVELTNCPRDRLDREKVRYLSKEERQYYLVKADDAGRLCWVKNNARVDTTEKFKDSIHGIVPVDDPTPPFNPEAQPRPLSPLGSNVSNSSLSSLESRRQADRAAKYANPNPEEPPPKGVKQVTQVSPSMIWNKLLRRSVKEGTWIFVADTSFRLYVGIKNSGAFQHSSFLQGSRISAAGLIKIKDGRITSLSPLSGHYRPPANNFRNFIRSLKDRGVDMSHVSVSKSYAVLVGLESYVKTRRKSRKIVEKVINRKEKLLDPEGAQRREDEAKDNSKSAQREREVIRQEEAEREENRAAVKIMGKLKLQPKVPKGQPHEHEEPKEELEAAPV